MMIMGAIIGGVLLIAIFGHLPIIAVVLFLIGLVLGFMLAFAFLKDILHEQDVKALVRSIDNRKSK